MDWHDAYKREHVLTRIGCRSCMVGLGGKERGLGESAKSKITSNIKNTVTDIKNLIGRRLVPIPGVCGHGPLWQAV